MLCISVPAGMLSGCQLRMLAYIARTYDRGYARFTANRSVEFHWPALSDIPAALADLASTGLYSTGAESEFFGECGADHVAEVTHGQSGHASVTIPLAGAGAGDLSAGQMEALADLAETYGSGKVHVGDGQGLVLAHVALADLAAVHAGLVASGLEDRRHSDFTPSAEAHHAREAHAA